MFQIDKFRFDDKVQDRLLDLHHGENYVGLNWPVAYIINNKEEAYVGETVHASLRAGQHRMNGDRRRLTEIRIISDDNFNKSVILDLEAFLIKYLSADGKYILQNGNSGLQDHDYYQKNAYREEFEKIWEKLIELGVATSSLEDIENSELYKYSPYKSLGDEQIRAEIEIINAIIESNKARKRGTVVIRGGAGTGKTILGIYLMKFFADASLGANLDRNLIEEDSIDEFAEFYFDKNLHGIKKIGIVIPQKSLQTSLKNVFGKINNLNPRMVLSPIEVAKEYARSHEKFDLLIVDEAHRLKYKREGNNLQNNRSFMDANKMLGLDEREGNELDWLMMASRNLILFRDDNQKVRPSDIEDSLFKAMVKEKYPGIITESSLETQWRCNGGKDYVDYIRNILWQRQSSKESIKNYDLKLFRKCSDMIRAIKEKEEEYELCRVVAGYAWKWQSKKDKKAYDILIQGEKYRWNSTYDNWIFSDNAVNEIGCVHTVQGYDLNYTGVIIGEDIKYDPAADEIYADKNNYFDTLGKAGASDPAVLKKYLLNIYLTLMTRGIKGTYIYVCDDELRKYFERFFDVE